MSEDRSGGADQAGTTSTGQVHRLRDLSRRERVVAALFVLAVVLAPVAAFVHLLPLWRPTGDTALMALRALDVGTDRTPVLGQPSSSGVYTDDDHVRHLGAVHFYLMAPFVRVFGASAGMLLVSVGVAIGTSVVAVWAVFRRFGPDGGVAASVAVAAVLFGMGSGGMLNPISSSFAGLPLFCSVVLAWAVAAGDHRLLPLAAGMMTFAVQQHLSVGPAVAMAGVALVVGVAVHWWRAGRRHDAGLRHRVRRWGLGAGAVVAVLCLPLLAQELLADRGNLSALVAYVRDGGAEDGQLGPRMAVNQVVNTLGWPPVVTRTGLDGLQLLGSPTPGVWVSAGLLLAVVAAAGVRWWRAGDPRRSSALMVGVLVVIGLVNGSSVPRGQEQGRLVFYHWIWPLAFFVLVTLLLLAADGARVTARQLAGGRCRRLPARLSSAVAWVAPSALVVVLAGVAVVNPGLDRPANTVRLMSAYYPRSVYDDLVEQVVAERDRFPSGHLLLLSQGEQHFEGSLYAVAVGLEEEGVPVLLSRKARTYAHDDRLAPAHLVPAAVLLLAVEQGDIERLPAHRPGERLARHDLPEIDTAAYRDLLGRLVGAERFVPGPELTAWLDDEDERVADWAGRVLAMLTERPQVALREVGHLDYLLDDPPVEPTLDPEVIRRLHSSVRDREAEGVLGPADAMEVYLVTDEDEIRALLADVDVDLRRRVTS